MNRMPRIKSTKKSAPETRNTTETNAEPAKFLTGGFIFQNQIPENSRGLVLILLAALTSVLKAKVPVKDRTRLCYLEKALNGGEPISKFRSVLPNHILSVGSLFPKEPSSRESHVERIFSTSK